MKNYEIILFDLDGCLTDPKVGITSSVQYALNRFGIIENNLDNLEKFIGPPLLDSFSEFYSFSDEEARKAINYYREYFSAQGIFENKVYDGIFDLLSSLKIAEKTLLLATSKPTVYAEKILDHFKLDYFFTAIVGSNLDGSMSNKDQIIKYALSLLSNVDKSKVVMIGDRKHDIIGAKKNQIDSIGVQYGYGSIEELKKANPEYIVKDISELKAKLLEI